VQIFGRPSSGFERQNAAMAGRVVDHFHGAVLLDPQLSDNNVVHTTIDVRPRVRFTPSEEEE
jgi:hypothetical protein